MTALEQNGKRNLPRLRPNTGESPKTTTKDLKFLTGVSREVTSCTYTMRCSAGKQYIKSKLPPAGRLMPGPSGLAGARMTRIGKRKCPYHHAVRPPTDLELHPSRWFENKPLHRR